MNQKNIKAFIAVAVIAFNPNSMFAQTLQWAKRYSTTGTYDHGNSIYVNASNDVFCGGGVRSGTNNQMFTVKYDVSGNQKWTAANNATGNCCDEVRGIIVDANGYIYVTGISYQGSSQGYDITLIKYNSAGTQQWSTTYGGTQNDLGNAIAVTGSGYVYVAGRANDDAILLRYNSAGTLQWSYSYSGTANVTDNFYDLKVATSGTTEGNVYCTGYSGNNGNDALLVKVNSAGTFQWAKTYNGALNADDETFSVQVDGQEYIYTAGVVANGSPTNNDALLLKYNSSGTLQWSATYNGTANMFDQYYDLSLDGTTNPNVYCTGEYEPSVNIHDQNYLTVKYNSSGAQQWVASYNGNGSSSNSFDEAYSVRVSSHTGKIFVTGTSTDATQGLNIVTLRYSTSGTQEWSASYDDVNLTDEVNPYYHPMMLGYDDCTASDIVYITGDSQASSGDYDFLTLKYSLTCCPGCQSPTGKYVETPEENNLTGSLYPNPFADFTNLYIDKDKEVNNAVLKIYDLFGNVVSFINNISSHHIIIGRKNLPAGIYFYQLTAEKDLISTGKIVIQ